MDDKLLAQIRKGNIEPALLYAVEEVVRGWQANKDKLTNASIRDTVSLINTIITLQKARSKGEVTSDKEDAFSERLRLVKDGD